MLAEEVRMFFLRLFICVCIASLPGRAWAQLPEIKDPRYRSRGSDCKVDPPSGRPLNGATTDSGIGVNGFIAERVITVRADGRELSGGEIVVCSEYGRVEILDSDSDAVSVQIRLEAFGDGAEAPGDAARRAVQETEPQVYLTADQGSLRVRVWHSTLGFVHGTAQPTLFGIRILVPNRGRYQVASDAYHGVVAVRRLTLSGGIMRGRVGEKLKGLSGYAGATELDHVTLAGALEIQNEPAALGAPIFGKIRVASDAQLVAHSGGGVTLAIQPHPDLGIRARADANGTIRILVDDSQEVAVAPSDTTKSEQRETVGFASKKIRLDIKATSGSGAVSVLSVPAAPLRRPT
jgi:hypothetical protein